jgi:tryptophanyl-tRNA synthetase
MQRILSGIQPSGNPHLGNYLGAMKQHIEKQDQYECIYMMADLHALTTTKDPAKIDGYSRELLLDYLALGIDPEKTILFRQSAVPEHCELTWIFSSLAHMGLMERAHAWKDAVQKGLKDPSVALFTYPILMAADILLYSPDLVPVGQDQKQHIEIARDLAIKFNTTYGETFKMPEADIKEEVASLRGVDGELKMSKSYKNVINFFAEEALLKKQIMGIVTDSKAVAEAKDPNSIILQYLQFFAPKNEYENFKNQFVTGGIGYGDAKKKLFETILEYFKPYREKRIELTKNIDYIERVLKSGNQRAREIAAQKMTEIKAKVGLSL